METPSMNIDYDEVMRRVEAIAPGLADNAQRCEEMRRVIPESIALMAQAGLFRILQPSRVHGYEMDFRTFADAATRVSEFCPSSGWVLTVISTHHWCMGAFPEAAQDEIFGDGKDNLIAGTLSWQGVAIPVDGGYRVEGRWQFGSGIDDAQWVMLGCADPATRGPGVHVVVPRNEIEIDDTWHVLGMRGTGSKDVVANGVFVPAHRTIDTRKFFLGQSPYIRNHPTNLYYLPAEAILGVLAPTALLGSAKFALRNFIEHTQKRRVIITGARKAEYAPTQIRLAEASAEIKAADLLMHEGLRECGEILAIATSTAEQRARLKWQGAYASELCRRAVGRLFAGSGAHAIYEGHPLQVAFRNINVGAQHASFDFENSAEAYGRMLLGVSAKQGNA
jgi:3-hydroxy-9,10-secoandrosta-1,3,5(10)-triene-9,17-dione monooxygenase